MRLKQKLLPLSRKKSDMNFEILKQAQIWSNISNLGTKRKEIHSSFHSYQICQKKLWFTTIYDGISY
jgi:hypothetical protein